MVAGATEACQSTRVQRRLVEILGRFVSTIYIGWRRPAEPDVTQLLETPLDRVDLLPGRLNVEVELGGLAAEKLGIHSRL